MASALFDVVNGLQLTDNRGFFTANGNVVVNALTTSGGLYWTGNGKSISGIAITASATPPTSPPPSIGDQWYNTSNDVVYQYQFDGVSTYWVDISSTVITANTTVPAIETVITDSIKANVGAYQLYANANIGTLFLGNSSTNANLGAYQIWANSRIDTLNANVGAYQIYANANASTQQSSIDVIYANVGAYQIWANANVSSLQTQINALAPASISEFQTYANSKIGTNSNSSILTSGLIVSNPSPGVAATITVEPFAPVGKQTWTFRGATGLGNPNSSWISFPDGSNQYTAYPGTATSLSALDANLGTATTNIGNLVTQANSNTAAYLTTYTGNVSADRLALSSYTNISISTGAETNRSVLSLEGNVYGRGGVGYFDAIQLTSTYSAATGPNKYIRLGPTGTFEIINSAYTQNIFSLTDAGALSIPGQLFISGAQTTNGPAFAAYAQNILQTVPTDVQTKVLFQLEEYDTNNNYANSRFTPTVAGYYQLNAEVRLDGSSGTGEMMIILYKNGGEYKRGTNQSGTQIAANFWAMQVSSVAYANGTTDYFEIYVQQGSGGDRSVTAVNNPAITWFNGCMLRGA